MSSYRWRSSSEGKQPARVSVASLRSLIGDSASENWPIDLKEVDALENLENWRLGDLHGEILGAQAHCGSTLKAVQDAIHARRLSRAALRRDLAPKCRDPRRLDAVLAVEPMHVQVHRSELLLRRQARRLNELLQLLHLAREMVEDEMTVRIRRAGYSPLPGHVHLFSTVTARRRRRKRVRLRKIGLRLVARGRQ